MTQRRLLRGLSALAIACLALPAAAQVQRSFINIGFEAPVLGNGTTACYALIPEGAIPGWTTTHPIGTAGGSCVPPASVGTSGRLMELWANSFNGVPAREGRQFAELNAAATSRMYQNVCMINGERIDWVFSHRGRSSASVRDVAEMKVGASSTVIRVGTTSNGAFDTPTVSQGTANAPVAGGNGWVDYSGNFTYAGATGTNSLGFESISTAGGDLTVGNFLDAIQLVLRPFVEFDQPSSSSPESTGGNLPALRINGTVPAGGLTVQVQVTGGTATLGVDYTTPGNAATFNVTVPAGTYDGGSGSLITLPIAITNDILPEGNETIALRISPPTGSPLPFLLTSITSCGGAAQNTRSYTITDDDASLAVNKNADAPVAVAGSADLSDVRYTVTVNNPSLVTASYSLTDTPGLDPDTSIVSAGYTFNGGASSALSGSGPWLLQGQWRNLTAGQTDTYVINVRVRVNRGGSTSNDACAAPSAAGSGLHNGVRAVLRGLIGNTNFDASACRPTPTPVWVNLSKQLQARVGASDQATVRIYSGGILAASAATSGGAAPTSASTGVTILPAGSTMQFEEAIKTSPAGPDQAPSAYRVSLSCSNASVGSATLLPSGGGNNVGNRQQWPEFSPSAGDDLSCTITNALRQADLSISKSDGAATYTPGGTATYTLTVVNNGPDVATAAQISDNLPTGVSLNGPWSCVASGGSCAASGGTAGDSAVSLSVSLNNGGSATITVPVRFAAESGGY
ncbi:DUF11 domain-containing protein [Lysobacter sp. cf310]|uniref:DUF11 domain-containing protein n=1 Tax=Lysobacter sp. cf310 TaxID=1761790 RepID=UPI0008E9E9C3|nr:DUF11 domain-containing protein [Lysobacter sp. cf310]SFL07896.1 conserved repeat domain-containing protein [Lysobacter sp. cf310]